MNNCPKCKSKRLTKNGFRGGRQRYKCKDCGFNPSLKERGYAKKFRRRVIQAYLEGIGIRALSRLFKIGVATVIRWIKEAADKLPVPSVPKKVTVMEIDELSHWINKKNR